MLHAASFAGRRILVAEDEYVIAEDIRMELEQRGAEVIGPVPTQAMALRQLLTAPEIDCALLDIKLQGSLAFDLADALMARNVPFIFATGYGRDGIPPRYHHIIRCEKPLPTARVVDVLGRILPRPGLLPH